MRIGRLLVFGMGFAVGYLAGSAAGRDRYDQIMNTTTGLAADLGISGLRDRVAERSADVVRTTTDAASDAVDTAADKLTSTAT